MNHWRRDGDVAIVAVGIAYFFQEQVKIDDLVDGFERVACTDVLI